MIGVAGVDTPRNWSSSEIGNPIGEHQICCADFAYTIKVDYIANYVWRFFCKRRDVHGVDVTPSSVHSVIRHRPHGFPLRLLDSSGFRIAGLGSRPPEAPAGLGLEASLAMR
jgi:hypothetical protein